MIVYDSTLAGFAEDVAGNRIEERVATGLRRRLGLRASPQEVRSFRNSLQAMHTALSGSSVPPDAGVALEYNLPQSGKRVDFLLTGRDAAGAENLVVVELKQWEEAWRTEQEGIVETYLGGSRQRTVHPSRQAWTYASFFEDYVETVYSEGISLRPCAYLHNCRSPQELRHPCYREHLERAPAFLRDDVEKLRAFVGQYVTQGDRGDLLYRIEGSRIRPSKELSEAVRGMLAGNQEFVLLDEQKLVYETGLALARKASTGRKQVLLVEGGPGTGKSVVAIHLLVALTGEGQVAHYATRNAAPREVYKLRLKGTRSKKSIDNLFKGTGSYHQAPPDTFDTLVVDEAHRLNEKSGLYGNLGENQVHEIIRSARCSLFFLDESQRVTWKDIGRKEEIHRWAEACGAEVVEMELPSQFRCNGSDGYLSWIDHTLQIRETAHPTLEGIDYEFRVFDDPQALRAEIVRRNRLRNRSRLVAGYCWDWKSKKNPTVMDIELPEHGFAMQWNLAQDQGLWSVQPDSVEQVGCIHTCQGLELDYVGVILGPDFVVRDGTVVTDAGARARTDHSVRGYRKALQAAPAEARRRADEIIRNTYRTLLTRGQRGCFVFCTDPETNRYFREAIGRLPAGEGGAGEGSDSAAAAAPGPSYPFPVFGPEEVEPFVDAVPLVPLEAAAGEFSDEQWLRAQELWVRLEGTGRIEPGMFIARVRGESMNLLLPNGAWCLFRPAPAGSRQGKVVLVESRQLHDTDLGQFTVKRYFSEKVGGDGDGGWRHARIRLRPESTDPSFRDLILEEDEAVDLRVIGEWVRVVGEATPDERAPEAS
jgi:hypothetical protein